RRPCATSSTGRTCRCRKEGNGHKKHKKTQKKEKAQEPVADFVHPDAPGRVIQGGEPGESSTSQGGSSSCSPTSTAKFLGCIPDVTSRATSGITSADTLSSHSRTPVAETCSPIPSFS